MNNFKYPRGADFRTQLTLFLLLGSGMSEVTSMVMASTWGMKKKRNNLLVSTTYSHGVRTDHLRNEMVSE